MTLRGFVAAELQIPLLAALDDPDRFLAAHLLESEALPYPVGIRIGAAWVEPSWQPVVLNSEGFLESTLDGLRVRLRPQMPFRPRPPDDEPDSQPCTVSVDPAEAVAVRDAWHRRLDVQVVSIADWQVVGATALLPLIWIVLLVRPILVRRRRARHTLCLRCGYDVRASADRCPECGEAISNSVTSSRRSPAQRPPALVSPLTDR
jgi:hypothetical protein